MANTGGAVTQFDVVVVGAGSAGAVLAGRLSENLDRSVLLLEAGPDHDHAQTPAGIAAINFFGAMAEPGRLWLDLVATRGDGQSPSIYVRGRGAGGSSAINGMIGMRGTPEDYDHWAGNLGCPGWGWAEMLAAFCALEDDADFGGDGRHGRGGPIPLTRIPASAVAPLDKALRQAATALGYPTADDYHAPGATGISRGAFTFRDGRRVSTNDAYLEPARDRPNLTVRGDALVDRVALEGRRAVGVVTATGEEIAAREVVVSAGAIHSPAILLRSGTGPEAGLPVGANLIDHASTAGFEVTLNNRGRQRSAGAPVINSLIRYSSGLAGTGENDMQIIWFTAVGTNEASLATGRLFPSVMRVYSRGEVRLRSADPHDQPDVDFRMLSDERDRVRLCDGIHRVIELVHDPAVAAIADAVTAGTQPIDHLGSETAINAWATANVNDYVHAVGTCRMGTPGDPAAVVDTECRVIGIDALRVCDASVMPDIPRANTHLTTVAIAERLATLMRRVPTTSGRAE